MKKEIKIRISACLNNVGNHCFKISTNVNNEARWIFPGIGFSVQTDEWQTKIKELCRTSLKEIIAGINVQEECSFKVEYSDKYLSIGEIISHKTRNIKFTVLCNDLIMPMKLEHIYLFHEILNEI